MGMWDGLKNVIYEFFHAGEMNENARNFLVAKGMKYLKGDGYVCAGARVYCSGTTTSREDGNQIFFNPTHSMVFFNGKKIMGTEEDNKAENFVFEGEILCKLNNFEKCILDEGIGAYWEDTSEVKLRGKRALLGVSCMHCNYGGTVSFQDTGQDSAFISFVSSFFDPNSRRVIKTIYLAISLQDSAKELGGAIAEKSIIRIIPTGISVFSDTVGIIEATTDVNLCYEAGSSFAKEGSEEERDEMGNFGIRVCDVVGDVSSLFQISAETVEFVRNKKKEIKIKEIEIETSERKIKELEAKLLQDKNLSVFEKRMLKNRISANEYSLSTNNINKNALENDIRKRLNKELQNLPRETSEFLNDKAYSEIIDSISNPWSENEELISSVTNNVSQKWVDYQIDVIRMTESDFYTTSPAFVPKGGK